MKFSNETKRAITLTEVLVIVAIVALPVGIFLPAISVARKNAEARSKGPVTYEVRVIRPDGQMHTSFTLRRYIKPQISIKDGCLMVDTDEFMDPYIAPSGWLIEIKNLAEAQ